MARKYHCPFCKEKFTKDDLVKHIDDEHDDELPPNYTAYRAAYDSINNKPGYGLCVICHQKTTWNEKTQKYNRLCGSKKCSDKVKEIYRTRMLKIYGKVHLLDDPNHQAMMLSHRHIAGKYRWSDGKMFEFVGSYEKEFLEFLDKALGYKSDEVLSPGPILEYEINGVKRHWITDFLIIPYNLIIEIKDGGSNPNKRNMPEYRAKQLAKEKMITNMGVYSYLRLTNKDFSQFLGILAELKKNILDDNPGPLYRIHEAYDIISESTEDEIGFQELLPDITLISEALQDDQILQPLNRLLTMRMSQTIIDHPQDDYLLYEIAIIKPTVISKRLLEMFDNYISNLTPYLHNITEQVEVYYKDLLDKNKGIGIGIVF